jgi:hypothetical protein
MRSRFTTPGKWACHDSIETQRGGNFRDSFLVGGSAPAQDKNLQTLHLAYGAAPSWRFPYWIAKEARLYEKCGLNVNLIFSEARLFLLTRFSQAMSK